MHIQTHTYTHSTLSFLPSFASTPLRLFPFPFLLFISSIVSPSHQEHTLTHSLHAHALHFRIHSINNSPHRKLPPEIRRNYWIQILHNLIFFLTLSPVSQISLSLSTFLYHNLFGVGMRGCCSWRLLDVCLFLLF